MTRPCETNEWRNSITTLLVYVYPIVSEDPRDSVKVSWALVVPQCSQGTLFIFCTNLCKSLLPLFVLNTDVLKSLKTTKLYVLLGGSSLNIISHIEFEETGTLENLVVGSVPTFLV